MLDEIRVDKAAQMEHLRDLQPTGELTLNLEPGTGAH
jgi:hypothetical protein